MSHVPLIRIVKGSSNFYGNLIRSYLRNHHSVHVFAQDNRINVAIWLIFNMSNELYINNTCVTWVNGSPTMSFLIHTKQCPHDVVTLDMNDGDFYIKYSKTTDLETMQRLLASKQHASIICAGSTCYDLINILPSLHTIGYIYYRTEVVRTYDTNKCEKAAIKVSIVPYNHEMLQQTNI
jgi:hypothetical protein